jgi:hypothetical protein
MIGYGNSVFLRTAWEVSGGVPPVNTVAPAITGTAQEGQTVTCSTGTWTGTPTITFAYQWKRNASNIGSATNSTYTLVTADVSQSITCQVTATNGSGSANATSNTITPTAAVDPDAQAFITAAGITNPTQQSAINTLVVNLKGYSIWTKFKAIYPVVGGSASSHAVNLKTPGTYNLTFTTGWTHASTGMTPNGTSAYANTGLNDNTVLSLNNAHISFYSRTNVDGLYCDIGSYDASTTSVIDVLSRYVNAFYGRVHDGGAGVSNSDSRGLFLSNRVSSTEKRNFVNSTLKLQTTASVAKAPYNISIGARNRGFYDLYSPRQCAFSSIGDGLTDTDAANFYTAVQAFQTTLSRQV